ncbi:type II toxin-antitoxin system VapC family toxin [Frondihabitans sp. VKM Ac-2883]|uniref:type II toxin-antitoxin system VapC family toxin n=1 Tax=Frondihabitans sp. VKM Ac-2883 TaxID=2783823 RepID=UPI00188A7542|nr:type II toxin-antitoxin system VapC family toxin [Frondihabitans sp. VKM Ac-2883]MBF4575280.1 type II toxin-antitoxin system VapC family toxin [Frondihabitans sp. VKM Ac-2883]
MIVLDANLLIGYLDADDTHHDQALDLLQASVGRSLSTSTLTLAEALVYPTRQGTEIASFESIVRMGVELVPLEAPDALDIARVRSASRLRMPDAVILNLALSRSAALATFDASLASEARTRGLEVIGA